MEKEIVSQEEIVPQVLEDKCPECGSTDLIHDYDTSETVCNNCGLVLREKEIDKGPEWRAFDDEQRKLRTRIGAPEIITIHDKGLSTNVGFSRESTDAGKKKISNKNLPQIKRLRRWQTRQRVHTSEERNLSQAMQELTRLSDKLVIPPSVKDQAAIIYRKAQRKRLTRGRSISAMVTASLYAACRHTMTLRTLREVEKVSFHDKKEIASYYRFLIRELEIKMPVLDSIACISKIAEKVGISGQVQGLATRIILDAKKIRIQLGKDPMGFAAAALYIACLLNEEKKTQKDIADIAQVTEVTVRNRYKELKNRLGLVLP